MFAAIVRAFFRQLVQFQRTVVHSPVYTISRQHDKQVKMRHFVQFFSDTDLLMSQIQPATLRYNEQGTPVSNVFDDVYFSNESGLDETQFVFLHNNQLPERWQQLRAGAAAQLR